MGGAAYIDGKKYKEFDNFYRAPFELDGKVWPTTEHYFQAQKCEDAEYQEKIRNAGTAGEAWELGQAVELRQDWEDVKFGIMFDANRAKFYQNAIIGKLLVATDGPIVFKRSTPEWNIKNAEILQGLRIELTFSLLNLQIT